MPLEQKTLKLLKNLEALADDRACAVCYHCLIIPWLERKDAAALYWSAFDCRCDWPGRPSQSTEARVSDSIGCRKYNLADCGTAKVCDLI